MYHRNIKLNFKSFASTLLAVLLMAGTVSTQTTSPTYPRRPDIKRQNPRTINAQELGPNGGNANAQRPSIKDLLLGEPPPPRENLKRGNDKSKTPAQQKVDPDRAGVSTIPHWSDTYTYQGLTYKYTMVGTDPKRGSATTTIPTVIIPIRFVFPAGTTTESDYQGFGVTDTEVSIGLEAGALDKIVNSPIFRPHDFSVGGVSVGNTQYGDAFQRANFWGSVSNGSRDYHVLLGQPTVLPVDVLIPVVPGDPYRSEVFFKGSPPDPGPTPDVEGLPPGEAPPPGGPPPGGELEIENVAIRADVFREAIENVIRQSGVSPQSLPIVLFDGKIYTWDLQTGAVGFGLDGTFEVPGGLQTFIASPSVDSHVPTVPNDPIDYGTNAAHDLSAHILNWLNDPFNINFAAGYPFAAAYDPARTLQQCRSDRVNGKLRVGDVLAGPLPPFVTPDWYPPPNPDVGYGYGHLTVQGYPINTDTGRYTLANGSFIDAYARETPTRSPAGRYTFFDVIRILYNLDENGQLTIPFRASDLPITSPAPPCVGHVEVEKQVIEFPDALWTRAFGINNGGTIVGEFKDASNTRHAFIYDHGRYSQLDYPGASFTIPNAVNDRGQIVGRYNDSAGVPHGFLYFQGSFTQIDFPGSADTFARGINNHGDITGMYDATQPVTHGFIFQGGQYRTIDAPHFQYPEYLDTQTDVTGINDRGQMVGFAWFENSATLQRQFFLDRGVFTGLPDFRYCICEITYPRTINNASEYGGWRYSPFHFPFNNDGNFGYVTIHGYTHTIDGYGVYGMNDRGQIVGYDFDYDRWRYVGYVATLPK